MGAGKLDAWMLTSQLYRVREYTLRGQGRKIPYRYNNKRNQITFHSDRLRWCFCANVRSRVSWSPETRSISRFRNVSQMAWTTSAQRSTCYRISPRDCFHGQVECQRGQWIPSREDFQRMNTSAIEKTWWTSLFAPSFSFLMCRICGSFPHVHDSASSWPCCGTVVIDLKPRPSARCAGNRPFPRTLMGETVSESGIE